MATGLAGPAGALAAQSCATAALAGGGDRVAVETGDMRRPPFADATFDVVVARGLALGGRALIADIRHHGEYAARARDRC